jgi:hypothetical protein
VHEYQCDITRKYAIKIVIEHAQAWNWDRKGGRNLCYKSSQQNQVYEYQRHITRKYAIRIVIERAQGLSSDRG